MPIETNQFCPCGSGKRDKSCCSSLQKGLPSSEPKIKQACSLVDQGNVMLSQEKYQEALKLYQDALTVFPQYFRAYYNLGVVHRLLGQMEEAAASYEKALAIEPEDAEALNNLGVVLKGLGRLEEATACYGKALAIKPDNAKAHNNLGVLLQELWQLDKAIESFEKAVQIKPEYADAYFNRGIALSHLGQPDKAAASYRRALEIRPDYAEAHSSLLFILNYYGFHHPQDYLLAEACSWEVGCISEGNRTAARKRQFDRVPLSGRRLRVGYVSGDFRGHAVSYFVEQLFANHDTSRVEVFAYSNNDKCDDTTNRIAALVEHWLPVMRHTDQELLTQIEADKIDVLIDLSGHTAHNRLGLFALRAAPVQAHWLGYFATTGLTEMDYWIGDSIITPAKTDQHFSETVWRLPRIWVSYDGKIEAPDSCWQPAADGTLCLGSFNNLGKITSDTISLWSKILHNMPEARLLLKTKALAEEKNRQRILDAFAIHGIEPERIELQPSSITPNWTSHMAYYDRLDIALDPVNAVSGGTTTCDALWMGVPVVGLLGDRMVSRMTASMLHTLDRDEWLAESEDEYMAKVIELARDVELRKAIRSNQRKRMASSPLCDAKGLAQALETAFEAMFDRWWLNNNKVNSTLI